MVLEHLSWSSYRGSHFVGTTFDEIKETKSAVSASTSTSTGTCAALGQSARQ